MFQSFFDTLVKSNSSVDYLISLGIFAGLFLILKFLDFYGMFLLRKISKKTKSHIDDVALSFLEKISWPFYLFVSFYVAALFLKLPADIGSVLNYVLIAFVVFYVARGITGISNKTFDLYKEKNEKSKKSANQSLARVIRMLVKISIWSVAILVILSNFGVKITAIVASLGVGGVAIAIALQKILGDLFSAFAIYLDKPFEEGDFIIIGNDMGTVKHIGIRSTRLEALGGQELVIGNSELTSSRINNYKKMNRRRIVFSIGVEYKTTVSQLKKIKQIVKKVIDDAPNCTLDRVNFKSFGDSSLIFEIVYYIESSDYYIYMDTQEIINLEIKEKVEKLGIDFAFPSTTVYLRKD